MSDIKNAKSEITQEELAQVSGGTHFTSKKCFFKPSQTTIPKGEITEMLCIASCFEGSEVCACHGTDRCVGKIHKMEYYRYMNTHLSYKPAPITKYNHINSQIVTAHEK